jgi:hypothetical protein
MQEQELPTIFELIAQATITETDIQEAIRDWKEYPPDDIYTELITPKIDDD